jgi:hypothetical protein
VEGSDPDNLSRAMSHQGVLSWTNGQDVFDFQLPNYPLPNLPDSLPLEMPSRIRAPGPDPEQFPMHCSLTRFVPADTLARVRDRLRCSHAWPTRWLMAGPRFVVTTRSLCHPDRLRTTLNPELAKGNGERARVEGPRPHRRLSHLLPFPAHGTSVRTRLQSGRKTHKRNFSLRRRPGVPDAHFAWRGGDPRAAAPKKFGFSLLGRKAAERASNPNGKVDYRGLNSVSLLIRIFQRTARVRPSHSCQPSSKQPARLSALEQTLQTRVQVSSSSRT